MGEDGCDRSLLRGRRPVELPFQGIAHAEEFVDFGNNLMLLK
jgi:hypothetical protein